MTTLQDQLRERVTTRWIHSTGTTPHASGVKPDALCHEAADRLDELEAEVAALRKFTGLVLGEHRMNMADVDGFDVQEWAVACGLLEIVEVHEPCGDDCECVEYHGIDSFPVECLRNSPIGQAAVDAAIEWGKT